MNMSLLLLVVQCACAAAAPRPWLLGGGAARGPLGRRTRLEPVGPCGIGGIGRILSPSYTFVSAPVVNYIFGCGSRPLLPDHQDPFGGPGGLFGLARPHAQQESQGSQAAQGGAEADAANRKPLVLQSVITAAAARLGQYLVEYLTMQQPTEGRSPLKTLKSWISD